MILYDKLKNVETEEKFFDFICPYCKADGMKPNTFNITPVGIAWKPDKIDNSDIRDEKIREHLDLLPTRREALIIACQMNNKSQNINVYCNNCKMLLNIYQPIVESDIRAWCNKNGYEEYLDLRRDKNVRFKRR